MLDWPQLHDGKLFSYILKVKAVDIDYIGKYKDEKAYSYWMSGFVDTVYASKCPTDATLTFLKGRVCPSQRIRDDPHKEWVCVKGNTDPQIITSWCTCIAGTGEVCNHVIAILYKINFAFHKKFISPTCASMPQGCDLLWSPSCLVSNGITSTDNTFDNVDRDNLVFTCIWLLIYHLLIHFFHPQPDIPQPDIRFLSVQH